MLSLSSLPAVSLSTDIGMETLVRQISRKSVRRNGNRQDIDDCRQAGYLAGLEFLGQNHDVEPYGPGGSISLAFRRALGRAIWRACGREARHLAERSNHVPGRRSDRLGLGLVEVQSVQGNIPEDTYTTPIHPYGGRAERLDVLDGLRKISPLQRRIVVRCLLHGDSSRDVGRQYGLSHTQCQRVLRRAERGLRQALESYA